MKTLSQHNREAKVEAKRRTLVQIACDECGSQLQFKPFTGFEPVGARVELALIESVKLACPNKSCSHHGEDLEAKLPLPQPPPPPSPRSAVTFICFSHSGEPKEFAVVVELPIRFEPGRDTTRALTGPGSRTILANGTPLGDVDSDYHVASEYVNALANLVNFGLRVIKMERLFEIASTVLSQTWLPTRMEAEYDAGRKGW